MADTYNKEQAKRLFGFIASGSSLGAIFGPIISLALVRVIGSNSLILISASMLLIPIVIVFYLEKIRVVELQNTTASKFNEQPMGSNIFAGFKNLIGGEIDEYTKLQAQSREQALERMINDAEKLGADAVLNVRFTTSMVMQGASEILAYGTAVKIK